jgi:outer membrane receptor protein involved in Fe transport
MFTNQPKFFWASAALIIALATTNNLLAQNRSRIGGNIRDAETGEPLIGVNVMIEGTVLGAATDPDGNYIIINVPVGTHRVKATMIGYESKILTDVMVSADRITHLDFSLRHTVIQGEEVIVTAQRDELHKEVSNTQLVVDAMQISDATGIREINSFLTKLPGVGEDNGFLTIRGGSADQTGVMVNGLSFVNSATGNAETSIPLSAVEQVSLLSGGYNAEYGNFRSGLINVTTKTGAQSGYHGTLTLSRDNAHIRRFGDSFYDTDNDILCSYLDPEVAFVGTAEAWKDEAYARDQHPTFSGWISQANLYNIGKTEENWATPMDYYLLACWMFMTVPDYKGLAGLSDSMKQVIGYYEVSEEQKKLFAEHHNKEENSDWNADGGFGGPVPLIGRALGNATFYLSFNGRERHYIMPVSRSSDESYTTLLTVKSQPTQKMTLTWNTLYKYQIGVSPIRPASGDYPDASRQGGFMSANNIKYIAKNPEYWFDPPFFPILEQKTLMNGLTINKIVNKATFWELSLSGLRIRDNSETGNTRDTTAITHFGPFVVNEMPYGKYLESTNRVTGIFDGDTLSYKYLNYDALPGIAYRFRRKEGDLYDNVQVGQYRAKFDLSSQVGQHHFVKTGFEYNHIDLNHKLWMLWNENAYNVYEFNYHRKPSQTGIYIQDQINFPSIVANVGLRLDYYYGGGGKWPSGDAFAEAFTAAFGNAPPANSSAADSFFAALADGRSVIWEKWEEYDSLHPGFLQPIKNHYALSPRLGISFPVTEQSKFYFNYGHFRSNPPYYSMYLYRYRYTKNGLYNMSNPNLEPPRTISYELGIATAILKKSVLKLSWYSKDVTGQHGEVVYQNESGTINYEAWANNEYEDIQGIEINLSKNDNSWLTGWINYNYMLKKEGLTGRSTITEVTINNDQEGLYADQEDRSLPLPKINANLTLRTPDRFNHGRLKNYLLSGWTLTLFGEWQAGEYFTWNPLNELHINNNLRWPDYYMVDLKINKNLNFLGIKASFFIDISNLFNFKVGLMDDGYCFVREDGDLEEWSDFIKYLASLHLPIYKSSKYDVLRQQNPGQYVAGHDHIGELRSAKKSYINDPNYAFWLYERPRDIWFGVRFSF